MRSKKNYYDVYYNSKQHYSLFWYRVRIIGGESMKQLNKSVISSLENDREPAWCVFCDAKDRCDSCDATDFGESDCGSCDYGTECTRLG